MIPSHCRTSIALAHLAFVAIAACGGLSAQTERLAGTCPDGSERRRAATSMWCEKGGQHEGAFVAWHRNGKPYRAGEFAAGTAVGTWRTWDRDGTLLGEGPPQPADLPGAATCTRAEVQQIADKVRGAVRDCFLEAMQFRDIKLVGPLPQTTVQATWAIDRYGVVHDVRVARLGGADLMLFGDCIADVLDGAATEPPPAACQATWRLQQRTEERHDPPLSQPLPEDVPLGDLPKTGDDGGR